MLTRSQADAVIFRTAVAAFTYYPDRPHSEPGYTIEEDLAWCLRPLRHLPKPELRELAAQLRELITDPSADRQAFIRQVAARTNRDT